jgi:hypothetical protein
MLEDLGYEVNILSYQDHLDQFCLEIYFFRKDKSTLNKNHDTIS